MTTYVLGGGPSLSQFDVHSLYGQRIIACNNAGFLLPHSWALSCDERWVERYAAECEKHPCVWIYQKMSTVFVPPPNWQTLERNDSWNTSLDDGLIAASNVGVPALHLADLADPGGDIVMIGFDMTGKDGKTAHFHNDYPDDFIQTDQRYDSFVECFRDKVPKEVKGRVTVIGPSRLDEAGFNVVEHAHSH